MLYEKLNQEMQNTVDSYVGRLGPLDWRRRGHLLAEAGTTLGESLAPEKSSLAARGFVTAVIERLGAPEVADPYQAALYLASLDAGHREQAKRYLAENPPFDEAFSEDLPDEN